MGVLILGAGMAGLAAARALAERKVQVTVLEAKQRAGGRVLSRTIAGGATVELGAEFVHGRSPELWALIAEAGVKTAERDGSMLREAWAGGLEDDDPQDDTMFAPLEALESFSGKDVPFAEWLVASDVPDDDRAALTGYVEGFNAADAKVIGAKSLGAQQRAEDAIEGDRSWHIVGGYSQLADHLAARLKELGVELVLGCEVFSLEWSKGNARVETTQGVFTAEQCIVTLPLGVLQQVNRGGLRMTPEPAAIAHARRLAMGHATRFSLVFRERWWQNSSSLRNEDLNDKLKQMSFLFTPRRIPPVWWTSHPETEAMPVLSGWVGGPRAASVEGKSAEQLGDAACEALAEVFSVALATVRSNLLGTYTHDWASDPFSLGAYSYVPAGAMDAPSAMTEPEAGTIFFAGEHTDVTANWGTVHAAIGSGMRAAAQVLGE